MKMMAGISSFCAPGGNACPLPFFNGGWIGSSIRKFRLMSSPATTILIVESISLKKEVHA
jgi:hypothetical protein